MRSLSAQATALRTSLVPPHVVRAWQQVPAQPDTCAAVCTHLHAALAAIMPLVPAPVRSLHLLAPERGMIGGMWAHGTVLCADLSGFTARVPGLPPTNATAACVCPPDKALSAMCCIPAKPRWWPM